MSFFKYYEVWKINLLNNLIYFMEFLCRALFIAVIIFIFVNLWKAVYASKPLLEGFTITMMIWYLVMAESIVTSQSVLIRELSTEIKSGEIAYTLNKPYNFMLYHFAKSLSQGIISFFLVFTIGGLVAFLMIGKLDFSFTLLPSIALLVLLALTIDFLMQAIMGISAFWLEDTSAFRWIYAKLVFTIGGMLVPLEILPRWLSSISEKLPFSFVAYHPAKLFVMFNLETFKYVISIQLVYILFFLIILSVIYKFAIRKVNIYGG